MTSSELYEQLLVNEREESAIGANFRAVNSIWDVQVLERGRTKTVGKKLWEVFWVREILEP